MSLSSTQISPPFLALANNFHVFFPTHGNEVNGVAFLRSFMLFGLGSCTNSKRQFKTPAQIMEQSPEVLVNEGFSWRYSTQPVHAFFDDLDDACEAAGVSDVELEELRNVKGTTATDDARMRILAPVFHLMIARGYNVKELQG